MKKILLLILLSIITLSMYQCKSDEEVNTDTINIEYGTVKDIDNNTYKTVVIGTQTWMAENLKVTKYNDGTEIPLVTDNDIWKSNRSDLADREMMCYYNNNYSNKDNYGGMYNWYVINSKKLCPNGWHVPNNKEWDTLYNYIGGKYDLGEKLQAKNSWNVNSSSDDYGFSALPSGKRDNVGSFTGIGSAGYWWSFTSYNSRTASTITLRNIFYLKESYDKYDGFSVRCVEN